MYRKPILKDNTTNIYIYKLKQYLMINEKTQLILEKLLLDYLNLLQIKLVTRGKKNKYIMFRYLQKKC